MKKYFQHKQAFTFLAFLVFSTSCDGQVKKELSKEEIVESKISSGHPKLIKTQGSGPGHNVRASLQDREGNLWFGTTAEGLYKYDGKAFIQFTASNGLNGNLVWCLLEDKDGTIWIGTEAGVLLYDGKTFINIQIPLPYNLPPNKNKNTHDVFSIMQDKSGKLWLATIDGVFVYDGKTFTHFIVDKGGGGFASSNNNVEYILEDKAGNIWFGGRSNEGVFRYDGKSVINLKINEQQPPNNWAWPVLQDKHGTIWFSNWDGAYRYNGKSFTKQAGLSGPVTKIIEDKKGNLWFGGGGRGICRYDRKSFNCFSTKDGLTNNDVWSILEDRQGNLWIGTRNTDLFRFDGKTVTSFSE